MEDGKGRFSWAKLRNCIMVYSDSTHALLAGTQLHRHNLTAIDPG